MSFQYPSSAIPSSDSSPQSCIDGRHSRRSLVMMASNLKPSRQKLHKYFTKSRHSAPESEFKDWNANGLGSVITMAGLQTGALGNPKVPISPPVVLDLRYKPSLESATIDDKPRYEPKHEQKFELYYEPDPFVFDSFLPPSSPMPQPDRLPPPPSPIPQPDRLPPPPSPIPQPDRLPPPPSPMPQPDRLPPPPSPIPQPDRLPPPPSPMPQPDRLPPPPPIPEFSQPAEPPSFLEPPQPGLRRGPSVRRPRPVSGIRRAKTPVHKIGQLEMAAAKKRREAIINRHSSVRTMARQYRALIDERDIPDVPSIPVIHRKPLPDSATAHLHEFDNNSSSSSKNNYGPTPRQSISEAQAGSLLEGPRPRCEVAPWPESDADTLVSSHDSPCVKPLDSSSPPTPLPEEDFYEDDDYIKSPDTEMSHFQIAFEMLTRELSIVPADESSRASGLQIWVMIEAYEKLRDHISSMETRDPELDSARAIFESWLAALRAIHKTIVNEGAESESEYGDEDKDVIRAYDIRAWSIV